MNGRLRSLAAMAALGALCAAPAAAAPRPGQPAPAFTLPRVDGGTLSLSQFRGAPVYLNFLASWCPPCNAEADSVVALDRAYRAKGLVTIGVDEQEGADRARGFIHAHKVPFAVVLDGDGSMGRSYGEVSLPVHVFIDRSGNVSLWRLGPMTPAEIESAIRAIVFSPAVNASASPHR